MPDDQEVCEPADCGPAPESPTEPESQNPALEQFMMETENRLVGLEQRCDTLIAESRNLLASIGQRLDTIVFEQRNLASDGHANTLARINKAQWALAEQINQVSMQILQLRSTENTEQVNELLAQVLKLKPTEGVR